MKFTVLDAIDILIVAFVIFKLIHAIRHTRAITLIKGLAVVVVAGVVAQAFGLRTVNWLLDQATTTVFVALPIVFYPELRRALEQLGQGGLFGKAAATDKDDADYVVDVVVQAAFQLSAGRVGALIVIERGVGLQEYIDTGIELDAVLSVQLLANVFERNSPLHDGAVIIRKKRIQAASCLLPLTERKLDTQLGTRHRAAIGLSEQSDALAVAVSEETGAVSLAVGGRLRRYLTESRLREQLQAYLHKDEHAVGSRGIWG
ncbi:MAG: TIGR00159 family protein [Firmicutes bacterium]|nr:diadenylate cyclase CdaA [Bacillota bacterium]NLL88976.1 TIGR00159 family protein [Bacillota bacterium]HKM17309.1 diadenylate cyclase CdaA [Limnochordia bacterium]